MADAKLGIVKEIIPVQDDTSLITLRLEQPPTIDFVGGQYVILHSEIEIEPGKVAKGTFTIISPETSTGEITLAVKNIPGGPCTTYLTKTLQTGDTLRYSGPWGAKKYETQIGEVDALFVATDTGISALLAVLNSANTQACLPHAKVIWFLSHENYFLDIEYVRRHLPTAVRDSLTIQYLAEPGVSIRVDQALSTVDNMLERFQPRHTLLAGDGDVIVPIQQLLIERGLGAGVTIETYFNHPEKNQDKNAANKKLRTGFTTGACSAAAAKAAARVIVLGKTLGKIETTLPNRQKVTFPLHRCELNEDGSATCSIIKDGGDDPDCTHGAELVATVTLSEEQQEIKIEGGEGIATVTKPGLGLEVGTHAINPVPRKNITAMVQEEIEETQYGGARVVISVPGGEEIAKKTTNQRLGLLGGISILGTTGIVIPYSTAAYRAGIVQQIAQIKHLGVGTVVLTTGGRSETFARQLYPLIEETCFVQAGDFIGASLQAAKKNKLTTAVIVGMVGKLSKMADGQTQTHQAGSSVNMGLLAELASKLGASEAVRNQILAANTARHVLEICTEHKLDRICDSICQKVVQVMSDYVKQELQIVCHLMDFEGNELGRHPREDQSNEEEIAT